MIVPEWAEPEAPAFAGPDAGLPTLYEFVPSAGPFVGRPVPSAPLPSPPPRPTVTPSDAVELDPAAPDDEARDDAPEPVSVLRQLSVVPDIDGPHVRLALLWAAASAGVAVAGRYWLGAWLGGAALLAGGQVVRSWRHRASRPSAPVVVFGAAALPLAAAGGTVPLAVAAAAVVVGAVVAPALGTPGPGGRTGRPVERPNPALTMTFALGLGIAAASPVIVRQRGLVPALVLLALVGAYDASAYVVGSGTSHPWEGPAAGIAFISAVTLAVAAVFVPPFSGASPWLLGLLAAALAPFGPLVGTLLLGEREARAPALRRLDSLLVLGPVWAAAALVLLKT